MTSYTQERKVYPNSYEKFREEGWRSYEDGAKVISFFCPSSGARVDGRVKEIPIQQYPASMNIREAFTRIEDVICTKSGKVRKSMESLQTYEEYYILALLHYLREQWLEGNRGDVELSWQEYYLLKPRNTKKVVAKKK